MSVLSLNSMVSPPSKSLEDMDARVSSHQFLVPSWAPAITVPGNLLLMCITYLQIRPHFASPTESNAFTWLHPLFPIICCLSLSVVFTSTQSVLLPCCACHAPPHSQKFLSTADNDNTSFIQTFLCHIKKKKTSFSGTLPQLSRKYKRKDVHRTADVSSRTWNGALGCISQTLLLPPVPIWHLQQLLQRCLYLLSGNC